MTAMKRRRFLKIMGWSTAGLTVALGGCVGLRGLPVLPYRGDPSDEDAALWLSLRPEGYVEMVLPRAEIGQGITISMRQIVAEELGIGLDKVHAIMARTDRLPPVRATVGSDSIKDYGQPLARAAAALRESLLRRAVSLSGFGAKRLALSPTGVRVNGRRTIPFAELAVPPLLLAPEDVARARPRALDSSLKKRYVGRPLATDGIDAMVAGGAALFADDIQLPGMLHGAVIRPPRLGATLIDVDDKQCRSLVGYAGLVRSDGLVGLLASGRAALDRAREVLVTRWKGEPVGDQRIERAINVDAGLAIGALEHVEKEADIHPDLPFDIDLRLEVPMAAHASMEPRTAVARFHSSGPIRLELWTGSQDPSFVHRALSKRFDLPDDAVLVHNMRVGGGFGGKALCIVELEAAILAWHAGKPVKVQWTRAEEFQEGYHRPPSSHRIRARLTDDGGIDTWWHACRSGHSIFTSAALGPTLQFVTSFVADPGVTRGARPPYAVTRQRIEFEDVRLPVDTGPWRGLGAAANGWATETAIDALARQTGEDPLQFRRRAIAASRPRLRRVLDRLAAAANWPRRGTNNRGHGVACGIYKDMSYAATIAEVEPIKGGSYRVSRLWAAHDCGLLINPDRVRAQVEGNLIWGIGMALHETLEVADGRLNADQFGDYAIPAFSDVPEMEIVLVDEGDSPTGAGETVIICAAAAITNAITALTGQPVTRLPVEI